MVGVLAFMVGFDLWYLCSWFILLICYRLRLVVVYLLMGGLCCLYLFSRILLLFVFVCVVLRVECFGGGFGV